MEPDTDALLITSHADIVKQMKEPFSAYLEDEHHFKGTYDNLGTNGICVSLMTNRPMPRNVYFSFTAEEESGRNTGAANSLNYVESRSGRVPTCMALDVTYEGYDENVLFTLEGAHGQTENDRRVLIEDAMATEGEERSFQVVPLKSKHDNSFLPEEYRVKDLCDPDESYYYAKQGCNSCSVCLPGDGVMHGDSGYYVKEPVMHGYEAGLAGLIYQRTHSFPELLEGVKEEKDARVREAKEVECRKAPTYYSYYGHSNVHTGYDYGGPSSYWLNDDPAVPVPSYNWRDEEEFPVEFGDLDETTKDELIDTMEEEMYEGCGLYAPDQFDMFFSDMMNLYNLTDEEGELRAILKENFDAIKESEDFWNWSNDKDREY